MNSLVDQKFLTGVFVAIIFTRSLAMGYFRGLDSYLKTFTFRKWILGLLVILPVAFVAFFLDAALLHFFHNSRNALSDAIAFFGQAISHNIHFWLFLGIVYIIFDLFKKEKMTKLIFSMVLASVLTGLVGHLMKFIFLRARPYAQSGPFSFLNWEGILANEHASQSLPSGDVAIIAGAAGCLFFAIRHKALRWLVLLLPVTTAYARIMADRHWPSDGLVSILLGLLIARLAWGLHKVSF